jgi:hypothetical protein
MRRAIVLSSLLLAISSLSQAQSKTLQQEKSQVTDARLGPNDWGLADVGCDAKGNVFVTAWNLEGEGPGRGPMFGNRGLRGHGPSRCRGKRLTDASHASRDGCM